MKNFRLVLAFALLAGCATSSQAGPQAASTAAKPEAVKQVPWAVQVEQVDSAANPLPATFSVAIYEDLVDQLMKSKRFEHVYRSGDHSAEGVSNLLTLKTNVEKFQQGSETTRAVTTVGGFTKIFVRMQLAGKDGKLLIDKSVEGKIRFIGENLKATQDLTKGMTKILVQTSLPEAPVAAK
jgi:hypothetical protein